MDRTDMENGPASPRGDDEIGDLIAALRAEVGSDADELDDLSRRMVIARATAEGWSPDQAEWLDKLAKLPFLRAIVRGETGTSALEEAYLTAKQALAIAYFEHALEDGGNYYKAFLTVVDLERGIIARRGDTPPEYSDDVLLKGCRAATVEGLSTEERIAAGFAEINRSLADAGT